MVKVTLWPNIRDKFYEDLRILHAKSGPWHAVLFSGDLVQAGRAGEFERLASEIFNDLWRQMEEMGSNPVLLAVPGNHDLVRPDPKQPSVKLLHPDLFQQMVADEFWDEADSSYRQVIESAFSNYVGWWVDQPCLPKSPIERGQLPGDFSVTLELEDGFRIGVVGLKTTFLQLGPGDYDEDVELRVAAANAMAGYEEPTGAEALLVGLRDNYDGVRKACLRSLLEIRGDSTDKMLLSRDLDGVSPWLDPEETMRHSLLQRASEELGLPLLEVRRRYESLAADYGLRVES